MLVKAHCIPLCVLLAQVQCQVQSPGDKKMAAVAALEGLQEEFWQWRLRESPPYAGQVGIHDTGDQLELYNERAFTRRKINDQIELMRIAIRQRVTLSNYSLTGVVERLQSLERDPHDSEFYKKYFENMPPELDMSESEKAALKNSGIDAVRNSVLPSFKKFKEFLIAEYIPNTRRDIGMGSLPSGLDAYKACLKFHLSLDMSPEEIHQTGLGEVARIKAEMEKIKNRDGFKGDLKSFIGYLRNKTELFYKTEEELINGYSQLIEKIKSKIWVFFKKRPKMGVSVRKTKNIYSPSSYSIRRLKNGTKHGYFNANVYQPWTSPKFNMMALTLHETIPGHHLQNALAEEGNLPKFRMFREWRHMSATPFNWQVFSACVEGWSLYAEYLGEEVGLYDEPYSLLGRYASESFRAARLVVDTGIHAKGWSRERAVQYLIDHTTLSRFSIESEVNRYISWPGQACAYKIGELKIKELRKKATDLLGSRFDIREFHEQILNLGASPLNVIEETIDFWIKSQTSAASPVFTDCIQYSSFMLLCLLISWRFAG